MKVQEGTGDRQVVSWPPARTPFSQPSNSILEASCFLQPMLDGILKSRQETSARNSIVNNTNYGMTESHWTKELSPTGTQSNKIQLSGLQKIQFRVQVEGEMDSIRDKMQTFLYNKNKEA